MESHTAKGAIGMGASSDGTPTGSRWNPTKEQISMLENLYKQGIRTPSTEQIHQITSSLRAYGHIEGKNVFYWFQNHKARQRQKQKQETMAHFNRFLHTSHPIFRSPLCQNAVCAPYWLPQSEMGFHPQHPKVLVPRCISPRNEKVVPMMGMPRVCDGPLYRQFQQRIPNYNFNDSNQETLDLFPQHPTGILDDKTNDQVSSLASVSADSSTDTSSCSPDIDDDGRPGNQPFFDFFTSGQGSRESDT